MNVKFAELGITDPRVMEEVAAVLRSGRFIGGPWLEEFSQRWAKFCGTEYCVPTSSGSSALTAAIKALVPKGGTVLLPALSFAATAFSVLEAGCEPLYVDVYSNGLMNMELANDACRRLKLDGVIPVHLYGQLAEFDPEAFNHAEVGTTAVIEDACQAHGAFGLEGDAACFSFYPSKNLGAAGDAGAVVTNWKAVAATMGAYASYGNPPGRKYAHTIHGTNARMDAVQAAILCVKLDKFWEAQARRRAVAEAYVHAGIQGIATQRPTSWHLYPILVSDRPAFLGGMSKTGIECGEHYPYVLPNVVAGSTYGKIPEAEFIAQRVVTLPIGPHMSLQQITYVIDVFYNLAIREVVDGKVVWRVKDAN